MIITGTVALDVLGKKNASDNGGMTPLIVGTGDTSLESRDITASKKKSFEEISGKALEEERRLAYVGITTAKENLINSNADRKKLYNQCQSMYI
jgi:superfamily I DNA/RNA helicase